MFLAYLVKALKTRNTAFQGYMLLVYTKRRVTYEQKEKDYFNGCGYFVIGAAILYQMSMSSEGCWGPGDFPMPDNSIRIICERIVTYNT